MKTEKAREYFAECGITYQDLTLESIEVLSKMIALELEKNPTDLKMKVCKLINYKEKSNGMVYAYIEVDGFYFSKREAISFNSDGFIGFCGWSSDKNADPIIKAFIDWCNMLKCIIEAMNKNGFTRNYIGNSLTFLLTAKKFI